MERRLRILHLEDNKIDAEQIRELLSAEGMDCEGEVVDTGGDFEASLESKEFDIILADYTLPSFDGLAALEIAKQKAPDIPFVFVTGTMGEDIAIESLINGATDYVLKTKLSRLAPAVKRAIEEAAEKIKRKKAEEALHESEEHIRQLIEFSPIAMVVSSGIHEKVVLVNQKFVELFGYTIEDIPDVAQWWPLAYPDKEYRETIKARWQTLIEQARIQNPIEPIEATVTCKDGGERYIEFHLSSIGERNLVAFSDLTERKRAEQEMAKQIEELRRWHSVVRGREGRIAELKREVNELLTRLGEKPRYESVSAAANKVMG